MNARNFFIGLAILIIGGCLGVLTLGGAYVFTDGFTDFGLPSLGTTKTEVPQAEQPEMMVVVDTENTNINISVTDDFCAGREALVIDYGLPTEWCGDKGLYYITDAARHAGDTNHGEFTVFANPQLMVNWLNERGYHLGSVWTSEDAELIEATVGEWCSNQKPALLDNGFPTRGCEGDYTYTITEPWWDGGPYNPGVDVVFCSFSDAKAYWEEMNHPNGAFWAEATEEVCIASEQ